MNKSRYEHCENIHNLSAPKIIVPVIYQILKPESVVDVGCGTGTFLHEFKNLGVEDILGIDGSWVDHKQLEKYIDPDYFYAADLEYPLNLGRSFDLAVCLEVAEHLKEEASNTLICSLTSLSKSILFSAAIPGQGGQNHVNEQWLKYWVEKFKEHHYNYYDVLRPIFWNRSSLEWWYKQNMCLFAHDSITIDSKKFYKFTGTPIYDYIHPDLFTTKMDGFQYELDKSENKLKSIKEGHKPIRFYIKLMLNAFKNSMR